MTAAAFSFDVHARVQPPSVHSEPRAARQTPARVSAHPGQARGHRCTQTRRQHCALSDGDVFSATEKQQLCEMLAFSDLQVDEMVALAQQIFTDAAHFEKVDRLALLNRYGVDADVVAIVEKAWRKKGKPAAKQIAAKYPLDTTSSIPILTKSNWRLHLEMGQSKLRGATDPTAIFQLKLQDPSGATQQNEEMLDLEMNHDELRGFFQQLNAIQAQIDRDSSAAQANAA